MQALLAANARVNLRQHGGHDGLTPLIVASSEGHGEVVRLLLAHGANVHARTGIDGTLPGALFWSVSHNQVASVNLLLAEGAVVDQRTLHEAVSKGRVEIARRLMAAGADKDL